MTAPLHEGPVGAASPAVELLAIGDELLLGETIDTNSAWISHRLAQEGITVRRRTTVGDDDAAIRGAAGAALRRTGVLVCTGGLGPTRDDLTRDAIAALYGRDQSVDDGWMDVLRGRYARRGIEMPAINRVQALLPDGATLLPNETGTAPGIAIDDAALGLTVLLPGVPSEMRGLMEAHVVRLLREHLHVRGRVESRVLRTAGVSEAALAERIDDIATNVAPLTLAFLPHVSGVDLRLTAWGNVENAVAHFDRILDALRDRLGDAVYAESDIDLAEIVGRMLRERGCTLALAESCTGGLVSKRLSDIPGASDVLLASLVTYHNDAKRELLGVREETLATLGAVSEACAREMAAGARTATGADIAAAITGIAGPGGATPGKPVGLVWYAISFEADLARQLGHADATITRSFVHPGDRTDVRERAAQTALDMLRRALMPQPDTPAPASTPAPENAPDPSPPPGVA